MMSQKKTWQHARDRYLSYLRTDDWKDKRRAVLFRDRGICQGCLKAEATQVHHRTYEHLYEELLFELVSLCDSCHRRCHRGR